MKRQSSLVIFHVETRFGKDGRPYTVKLTTHSNKGKTYGKKNQPASVQAPAQEEDFTGFEPSVHTVEQEQAPVVEALPGPGEVACTKPITKYMAIGN